MWQRLINFLVQGTVTNKFAPDIKVTKANSVRINTKEVRWLIGWLTYNSFLNAFWNAIFIFVWKKKTDVIVQLTPSTLLIQYPNYVCKLQKSLSSLKQAPRNWFSRLSTWLICSWFQGNSNQIHLYLFINHLL